MSQRSKINKIVNKLADQNFVYGKCDCFTFTDTLVKEFHGKSFRPLHKYKNKEQAEQYIKDNGGIEALTIGTLGYAQHPSRCKDGDVVTAEVDKGQIALGFVLRGVALFKTEKKVLRIPLDKCRLGWRIN